MAQELTPEQIALFPSYVEKWVKIGTCVEPTDAPAAIKHIKEAYAIANLHAPEFFIGPVNSPHDGALAEAILHEFAEKEVEFDSPEQLNTMVLAEIDARRNDKSLLAKASIGNQIYGYQEYWLSYYDFFQNECGLDLSLINPLLALSKVCGWWTPLENVAIFQHRPEEIHRDAEGRLHNVNGPAVKFRGKNSKNVYSVHGVRVTEKIINRDYNVSDIEKETNAEVRRVMIELYGQEKFIIDSNTKCIHSDDYGSLYRKELEGDEPLMMVKVVNSTMEPDGTFKDYWIRVDPNAYGGLKTAKAAVASTWRDDDGRMLFDNPDDYVCLKET